jgi:endonuclease G
MSKIDFREEFRGIGAAEFRIDRVLFIAPQSDRAPDVAFLKLKGTSGGELPAPVPVHTRFKSVVKKDRFVAVVGYPARDSRNSASAMSQVFGDIYDVKRFAPGVVMGADADEWWFTHDCSTLGGNSGSAVLDIETGKAVGLHFAGTPGQSNFAVRIDIVLDMLTSTRGRVLVPVASLTRGLIEKVRPKEKYTAPGYDERFLGSRIPMPTAASPGDSVRVERQGQDKRRLDYMHFSVRMSRSRRLPAITAVNIDGRSRRKLPRKQSWFFDPRLRKDQQVGKAFYGPTEFDRGHMVRREDPVWGPDGDARLANEDTFHYTNAAPQHPDLNQREWSELEDYILDNADARDVKVSVFTGPVFDDDDPVIEGVRVPLRFWKVAAVIDDSTGKLATAGYILSQQDMVAVEFRYGAFKVYQVAIRDIEEVAKVRFGQAVRRADGFAARVGEEGVPSWAPGIEIRRAEDVRFT